MPIRRCVIATGCLIAALFVVFGAGGLTGARAAGSGSATICAAVTLLEGASTVALPPLGQQPLTEGETLRDGSILQTKGSSRVELTLADDSVVRIGADSSVELAVDIRNGEKHTRQFQVKLLKGEMWVTLPGLPEGDPPLQVLVAGALLVGNESAFRVVLFPSGAAEMKVYSGYVTASGPFVFPREDARFLLQSGEDGETPGPEPWRYRIEPYMKVIVQASGEETKPFRFTARADLSDWVKWNQSRDAEVKRPE